jgi:arylsulfatase A-like enzyme
LRHLIVLCIDSLRQDHVGFYRALSGRDRVFAEVAAPTTPHLDAFARRSLTFRNAYPCNLPTIPIRHELMTGCFGLHDRPWQPLLPTDLTVAEILAREGFTCGLVSDNYHFRAPGMNFHRAFHSYDWVRGNEYDPWVSAPPRRDVQRYTSEAYPSAWRARVAQYLANTDAFRPDRPEDWFAHQVARRAADWLEANRAHDRIFLWVDCFDPHEPWDPPAPFDVYRPSGYEGPRLIMPMGGRAADWATPEQIGQIRGLYAGEAASVDAAVGLFLTAVRDLGYMDDSIVLVLADHGHPLGDHGKFLKGADRMYAELLKVPFMLYVPGGAGNGRVSDAIVQYPDVLPTLLELLGLPTYMQTMTGRSFRAVVESPGATHRAVAVSGYFRSSDRSVRDTRWAYVRRPAGEADELYDLVADPHETENVIDQRPEVAQALLAAIPPQFLNGPVHSVKGLQGQYEMRSSAIS